MLRKALEGLFLKRFFSGVRQALGAIEPANILRLFGVFFKTTRINIFKYLKLHKRAAVICLAAITLLASSIIYIRLSGNQAEDALISLSINDMLPDGYGFKGENENGREYQRESAVSISRSGTYDRIKGLEEELPVSQDKSNLLGEKENNAYEEEIILQNNSAYNRPSLEGRVVAVDAGHGGYDGGCSYDNVNEKDVNLDIALKLGKLLELAGIEVIYTREKDAFVDLKKRAEIANDAKAQLFISIHNNAMEDGERWSGTETLYGKANKSDTEAMNDKKLARLVQDELIKQLGTFDRGIVYRPKLAVLNHSNMPAVIAEVGFISNSSDREKLKSPEFRLKAAYGLYNAVISALEQMK